MEAVDDKHRLLGFRDIKAGYHLAGETFTTLVDCSHTEAVELTWFDRECVARCISFYIIAIVEAALSDGGIDDITCGVCRRLIGVVDWVPADTSLTIANEFHAQPIGRQWGNGIIGVVHTADVTQEGLVDAACKIEAEVGILRIAHVGKVLVGEGLEDGTGE